MESPHREEPILTSQNIVGILRILNLGYIHLIADCICAAAAAGVVAGVVAAAAAAAVAATAASAAAAAHMRLHTAYANARSKYDAKRSS